ncbi:reticulate body protein Rbp-7 [Chlamydia pecorum]|uniref:Uncharacterized protein n=2 Tax=Chlamydia pecorum TaxID=85991 RepID=A0AA40PQU2_9CHLA|nr:reticulate body protein Rbp-7 [Chlamydia pecorum]AGW38248.1 hypothetical protein CPE1_0773 [Chlamydia pecorum PV3056/3]AGW39173.1 hypothetical protein CPE2_0774 [Chlamydia pecorum W73]AGW40099.1 hypothetical protein CPE3_0774 [Chlamydia pecorum P787]ETF38465.1 hypothetical protein CpecS_0073 [Chlamydia pecorum VR629]ETF38970.1 hypothetical protein CpecF_0070 [Chlamydia pecorum DBDeUG]
MSHRIMLPIESAACTPTEKIQQVFKRIIASETLEQDQNAKKYSCGICLAEETLSIEANKVMAVAEGSLASHAS